MCRKFSSTTFAEFKCNVKMPPHSSIEHKPNSIWTLLAVEKRPKRKMFHNITFFRFDKSSFHIFVLRWNRNFVETEERFNSVFYASFVSRFFFAKLVIFAISIYLSSTAFIFLWNRKTITARSVLNPFAIIHLKRSNDVISLFFLIRYFIISRRDLQTECFPTEHAPAKMHKQQYFAYDICFRMKRNENEVHIWKMWLMRVRAKPTEMWGILFFSSSLSLYLLGLKRFLVVASISMVYLFKSNGWVAYLR